MRTPRTIAPQLNGLRQAHFVDADNLTCGPNQGIPVHARVRSWYDAATLRRPEDLCFVAASHHSGFATSMAWAGAKVYWRSGVDGADLALIDAIAAANLADIGRVCLGSGDGIFRHSLDRLRVKGMSIAVIGIRSTVSSELERIADDFVLLPNLADGYRSEATTTPASRRLRVHPPTEPRLAEAPQQVALASA